MNAHVGLCGLWQWWRQKGRIKVVSLDQGGGDSGGFAGGGVCTILMTQSFDGVGSEVANRKLSETVKREGGS